MLTNPRLRGYDHAVEAVRGELVDRYGFWDLWIFVPDADLASLAVMQSLESELAAKGVRLLCCPAEPEIEIYACAGYLKDIVGGWAQARTHPRMKEIVFAPLLEKYGDPKRAGGGRDVMIAESLCNLPLLLQLCPELESLRARIAALLGAR